MNFVESQQLVSQEGRGSVRMYSFWDRDFIFHALKKQAGEKLNRTERRLLLCNAKSEDLNLYKNRR